MPDVSIIIPTYNRARFVGEAIDSALAQGDGIEVIVVDDGSTDETSSLLASFADRVRIFRQPNTGPSAARNLGAQQARGEFLAFLDSDDLLEAGAVRTLLSEARRLGPGAIPFGRASVIDEAGAGAIGPTYGFPAFASGYQLGLADLLGGIMPLWLTLLRRDDFLTVGGLNPDLRLGEDQELAVRLHLSGRSFIATGTPTTRLRLHDAPRLSDTANHDFAEQLLRVWTEVAALCKNAEDYDGAARQALARSIWTFARDAARASAGEPASDLFALAQRIEPQVAASGPLPLRLLTRLVGPYRAERVLAFGKRMVRPA